MINNSTATLSQNSEIKQLEGGVGLVTAFAVLHWAPDQTQALRNAAALLRSGGKLIGHVLARYPRPHADLHSMLVQSTRWQKNLVVRQKFTV